MSTEVVRKPVSLGTGVSDSQNFVEVMSEGDPAAASEASAAAAALRVEGSSLAPPTSALSHGSVATVDAKQAMGETERMTTEQRSHRLKMRDLVAVLHSDDRYSEVTVQQVERVKMMHDKFYEGAIFCFNYNTLLLVASVIAALGLASDNSTTIIASMLVSPIMGPVVAIAYGTTICDRKMVKMGLFNELVSLIFCILIGGVVGAICGVTPLAEDWLTKEMLNRATVENFLVGLPVAFFSGLGVAVGLLDDQTNSLVGVAISASLLPPAVDAGMIWVSYALYQSGKMNNAAAGLTWEDFRKAGLISLSLTLANIVIIWLSSMLMFRLKEVLPIKKRVFWSDLGIARKIYQGKAIMMPEHRDAAHDAAAPTTGTGETAT